MQQTSLQQPQQQLYKVFELKLPLYTHSCLLTENYMLYRKEMPWAIELHRIGKQLDLVFDLACIQLGSARLVIN